MEIKKKRNGTTRVISSTIYDKMCDIDIVVQGSSVQRETKDNRNVEQESSCQHDQERINDKAVDEKEFLIREEIKEKPDADKESSVEEIQNDIKDKGNK